MRRMKDAIKIFLFLFLYLLSFAYAGIFNNDIGWTLFLFLTLFLLLCLIHLLIPLSRIVAESPDSLTTHVKQSTKLPILFSYPRQIFPIIQLNITLADGWIARQATELFFMRQKQINFQWTPTQRGLYEELSIHYQSSNPLFSKTYWTTLKKKILVLPQYHRLSNHFHFQQAMHNQPFGEPTFTIKNYRPYRSGDALKNIDWKLSSKQTTLIYREQEHTQLAEPIWLFWGNPSPQFEEALSYYYSLQDQVKQTEQIQQYLFGNIVVASSQIDSQVFANIQPFENRPFVKRFKGQELLFFTPELDSPTLELIEYLKKENSVHVYDLPFLQHLFKTDESR